MKLPPSSLLFRARPIGVLLALGWTTSVRAQPDLEHAPSPPPPPTITDEVIASQPSDPPQGRPPSNPPDTSQLLAQLELLYDFLSLPPEHLQRIQRTLALIEKLSPEERAKMRRRLESMQLDLGRSDLALREFSDYLPPADTLEFRRYWISLKASERDRLVSAFEQKPEVERADWIQSQLAAYRQHLQTVRKRLVRSVSKRDEGELP